MSAPLPSDAALLGFARRALNLADAPPPDLAPITRGGSDRVYRRLTAGGSSWIVMQYGTDRRENASFAPIARFLAARDIRVPVILAEDAARGLLVLEDLGDRDLWSYRDADPAVRLSLYRRTLRLVHRLHGLAAGDAAVRALPLMDPFDAAFYRWERDYFREHFVRGVCALALDPSEAAGLEAELAALAARLGGAAPCLVHRDLQSQNVMIRDGEPVLIDFQGMRLGSRLYDLGALLYDPYVRLTPDVRLDLLRDYYDLSPRALSWNAFREAFQEASVQRLLQALGAYGYLGLKAGQPDFLAHMPRGLDHLEAAAGLAPRLDHLRRLLSRCRRAINR
ncbi:MAG: phosphotransferase [Syntrophales bacterium]|nr:phosphotransferase [Syntrophales bacterium]HOG08399.1 phosphotransferase [Syntrophales bacterium]HOS78300.1 phosphotransferase [Syntrophales bacterium]HPB70327.1 phosphotransferase [Syntrophales bacterium]HQN26010.1 phosphotransferase [Syntrophales bacterium]